MSEQPSQALRLLIIEDSEDDAVLLVRHLRESGYDVRYQHVSARDDVELALASEGFDCVITDHNMPAFTSFDALAICAERAPDLPVIIVSGTIGEEHAVDAMRAGARDYVMKDNLARLVPAITRELEAAAVRREQRSAEEAIAHLAYHDGLTGLVNRTEFELRLEAAVGTAREGEVGHCLCYLDLDQFKVINDTCGHVAGDALLREVGSLLGRMVRSDDVLARLGGDEFGLLMLGCPPARAERIANDICRAVEALQFAWDDKLFRIGCSIGLVAVTGASETVTTLLSAADSACYAAKDQGRGRVHVHREDDEHTQRRHSEMSWVSRINQALERDTFQLAYQPIVPARRGAAMGGIELLVRFAEPGEQLVPPGAFLPAAERYGLAGRVDRWVVEAGLRSVGEVPDVLRRIDFFSINLSAISLADDAFLDFVKVAVEAAGLPDGKLCFEITETAAISNLSRAVAFMRELKALGCRFALDDFGSGMCSFAYLKSLPVDMVKIDGTFVRDILSDPFDRAIVRSINDLAHEMGITTAAEFVENDAIRKELARMGVDLVQGFHVSQVRSIDELAKERLFGV